MIPPIESQLLGRKMCNMSGFTHFSGYIQLTSIGVKKTWSLCEQAQLHNMGFLMLNYITLRLEWGSNNSQQYIIFTCVLPFDATRDKRTKSCLDHRQAKPTLSFLQLKSLTILYIAWFRKGFREHTGQPEVRYVRRQINVGLKNKESQHLHSIGDADRTEEWWNIKNH